MIHSMNKLLSTISFCPICAGHASGEDALPIPAPPILKRSAISFTRHHSNANQRDSAQPKIFSSKSSS